MAPSRLPIAFCIAIDSAIGPRVKAPAPAWFSPLLLFAYLPVHVHIALRDVNVAEPYAIYRADASVMGIINKVETAISNWASLTGSRRRSTKRSYSCTSALKQPFRNRTGGMPS